MGAPSIEIVAAGSGDAAEIIPLMVAFNAGEGIPWRPEAMGAALRHLLREPSLGLMLISRDRASRAVVGYGMATFGYDIEFAGADAFITELFVEPSFRGRGLGRDLLDAIVEKVRAHGAHAVHLMVRPENERAKSLYESRRFRVVPRLLMTKVLAPSEE